jgi:nucleoside-triphosphatase THEP1
MTGGPGFGKTTIVEAILRILQRKTPACCSALMGV